MSGFDENPFDDNPFKDPAIQQVTKNTANTAEKDLEDYNPFDDSTNPRTIPSADSFDPIPRTTANPQTQYGGKSPAVMSPTQEVPTVPFANRGQQQQGQQGGQISTEELQKRQEELERKARELERREEELKNNPYNVRRNNWPPLPEILPLQPCFYQDINVDIPVEFQRIVRHLYYLWIIHAMVLLVNTLVLFLQIFIKPGTDSFMSFGTSLIYIVVFTPLSFICWFRPAYKAFRSDSSFNFMVFFFVFFFQFVVAVLLSTIMTGSCGLVSGIHALEEGGASKIVLGIFILIVAIAFAISAIMDLLMLIKVHKIYRSSGASFAKAQQEFTTGVMRNEHVQGAAANIASEAIRSQFNRGATPGANGSSAPPPRY